MRFQILLNSETKFRKESKEKSKWKEDILKINSSKYDKMDNWFNLNHKPLNYKYLCISNFIFYKMKVVVPLRWREQK